MHSIATQGSFAPSVFRFEARDTTINQNTKGVASVMVARPTGQAAPWTKHAGDILFTFVMPGEMTLEGEGKDPYRLSPGDAFVIPPGMATRYSQTTPDFAMFEVTLPWKSETLTWTRSSFGANIPGVRGQGPRGLGTRRNACTSRRSGTHFP